MRNLKRALSLALASVMVMGMMVVGTSASYKDVSSEYNQEAIEVLQKVGIMVGDDAGNFNPDAKVTRNEMAVIMCNLLDYTVASYKGTSSFVDVPEWAEPYVAACYTNGITAGISATLYGGSNTITTGEAALMLMKALGYFQEAGDFGQDWLVATVAQGSKISLFDGIETGAKAAMTRNDVAQMVLNALEADMVQISDHDLTVDGNGNLATKAVYTSRTSTNANYNTIGRETGSRFTIQLGEDLYSGKLVKSNASNYDDFGRPSTVWTYKGSKVGTYADAPSQVIVMNKTKGLDEMLLDTDYFDLDEGTNTDQSGKVEINGGNNTHTTKAINGLTATDAANIEVKAGDVVEIYNNKYGYTTAVVVCRYTLAKVDEVDDNVTSADAKDGTKNYIELVDLSDAAIGLGTYRDNKISGYDADVFAEGNFVAVALSMKSGSDADKIIGSYAVTTVNGGISDYKLNSESKPYIVTDGTKYPLSGNLDAASIKDSNVDFEDGTYAIYVDANGYVLGIDGTNKVNIEDVYYVAGVVMDKSGLYGTPSYYAQAVSLVDGTIEEIKLETSSFEDFSKQESSTAIYADTAEPNKLYSAAAGLYSFSDNDAGTHNINSGANTAYKSKTNNGKLTATAYNGDGDDYFVVTTASAPALKKSDTSARLGSTKVYLEKTTQYLTVEANANDIDVDLYTGGVNVAQGLTAWTVYSKEGSAKVAQYVVLAGGTIAGGTDINDVVYLKEKSNVKVKDGYKATLYKLDGTVLTDVTIDSNHIGETFYTYNEKDGVYTLSNVSDAVYGTIDSLAAAFDYDKETGKLEDVVLDSIYNDGLTIKQFTDNNNTVDAVDVDAANAIVMDVRGSSERDGDVYKAEITDLSRLEAALKRGVVKADLYFDDGDILLIAVTDVASLSEAAVDSATAGGSWTWLASMSMDGNTVTMTAADSTYLTENDPLGGVKKISADLARYLGGLYRGNATTKIVYDGVTYTWDTAEPNVGSNWYNGGTSLVKAITDDWKGADGTWNTSDDGDYVASLETDTVTLVYKVEISA